MTTVNWEREPGEKIEEFVAAMLLLESGQRGNRITPSRGDGGVDVRIRNPGGFAIYQIKRYSRPLTAKQATEVEQSWETFTRETLPVLPVTSWTLAMPWDPSKERLAWLARLTASAGIETDWMGRDRLDILASKMPLLVDYYFGDGGERLHRLMAAAFQAGRDLPTGQATEDMIQAIIERYQGLKTALNEVDPFYRYEISIHSGRLHDRPFEQDLSTSNRAAFIHYEQLDPDSYLEMRVIPLCAESLSLRPITLSAQLNVERGSPEHQAVQRFFQFGTPFRNLPGAVTEITGPPGITSAPGSGLISFMTIPAHAKDFPDLEARLIDASGSVLHCLDLIDVEISHGVNGGGMWLAGLDPERVLRFECLLNGPEPAEVRIDTSPLEGRSPACALPALRLAADLRAGAHIVIAIRHGQPITPTWEIHDSSMADTARQHVPILEALVTIQGHTYSRISIPSLTSAAQVAEILDVARLLRGEQIEADWKQFEMTVAQPEHLPAPEAETSILSDTPLTLRLEDQLIAFNMRVRTLYRSARLADPARTVDANDTVTLVPGSVPGAIQVALPPDTPETTP